MLMGGSGGTNRGMDCLGMGVPQCVTLSQSCSPFVVSVSICVRWESKTPITMRINKDTAWAVPRQVAGTQLGHNPCPSAKE